MDYEQPATHGTVNEHGESGQFSGGNPAGVPFFPYVYDPTRYFVSPVAYDDRHVAESGAAVTSHVQDYRQFGPFFGISPFGPTIGFGFGLPLFPRPFYPYPFYPRPYWWW
ncbi:hypothetical protein [Effusibacillus pohliae]|uniref:hypothetical protein n=1 Tax=Effusibacillus pohliae TaxID=232270 RepID=UPI0003601C34|nr:hypothetical protein [Effusibacillus pohliae]